MLSRYDCKDPYDDLDDSNRMLVEYEEEMAHLQESASLFELNIPEFKYLKQCRKELRMLKVMNN